MNLRLTLLALLVALATPLVAANAGPAAPQAATISIGDVTVTEGDTGATTASFTVTLSESSPDTVTVDYATADGSAAAPGDYTAASGTLTFLPDETTQTVSVDVNGDTLDEDDETFTVELSNPANATIDDGEGVGTITDDDPVPTVSIGNSTVTEGNTGTVTATFTATLDAPSGRTVTVDYATADGTATAPGDYLAASGTVTFLPNQTSRPVSVTVNGDTLDEANETYLVTLSNPTNATILDGQGLGTITDDDTPPTVSVDNVTVTEGNSGNVNATFDVSLSTASGQAASVNYATADGTATAPADYAATSGTLNFAAGETTKQVTVLVHGDTLDEANETFTLNLSNPTQRDDRGRDRRGDDHGRRRPAHALGQQRHGHRGRQRHGQRDLHRVALGRERAERHRRLRDRGRHGHRSRRLHGYLRHPHLHRRPDLEAGDGARQRRHARRAGRDVHAQPLERGQRDDRRRHRHRDDHRRRRPARRSRSTTSRSTRETAGRRTRTSRSPCPPPAGRR